MVGMEGFEPSQYYYQGILSPSRLPFRHIPKNGGSYQIRTGDHRVAVYCLTTWLRNQLLKIKLVEVNGLEPLTLCL